MTISHDLTLLVGMSTITAALLLGGCGSEVPGEFPVQSAPTAKNVVLITIDTLRADHLSSLGWQRETSPTLDALAAQGASFTQAEVQWPKTSQSMTSLMTSTYVEIHGVRQLKTKLDDRLVMVAEILKDAGFYNAAFISNPNLAPKFNFPQGFDEVHPLWEKQTSKKIADRAVAWLGEERDERFFLWVHFLDPHSPYGGRDLRERFVGDELFREQHEEIPASVADLPWMEAQKVQGHRTLGDFVAAYDAEILGTDRAVGRILNILKDMGMADSSLVVVTADHGESLGDHEYYFGHGFYAYEACTHVPLILRFPGRIPAGLRVDTPVPALDVTPTILDLLGVPFGEGEAHFQGRSLAPFFEEEERLPEPIFIQSERGQRAVRVGKWKFIHDPREGAKAEPNKLFDLSQDPHETRNLIESYPKEVGQLRALLDDWFERMLARPDRVESEAVPESELDPEMRKLMEQLGYVR